MLLLLVPSQVPATPNHPVAQCMKCWENPPWMDWSFMRMCGYFHDLPPGLQKLHIIFQAIHLMYTCPTHLKWYKLLALYTLTPFSLLRELNHCKKQNGWHWLGGLPRATIMEDPRVQSHMALFPLLCHSLWRPKILKAVADGANGSHPCTSQALHLAIRSHRLCPLCSLPVSSPPW